MQEASVENVARVVLALEEHDVAEEVMHFLDRSGVARVVATAADDRQLLEAVRQLEPDAVVAQPVLVTAGAVRAKAVLAVDTRESVASLRAAIRAGARGFYVWPGERAALADATASTVVRGDQLLRRATVVGVHAPRGGAGCTFVATHLAAAFARRGDCVLVDADPAYGDVTPAIGAPAADVHTAADLVPLLDELDADRIGEALWEHPSGFRALLAPPAEAAGTVEAAALARLVDAVAAVADTVVVHLPRGLESTVPAVAPIADRVVEVLSLDVLSFRAGQRAIGALTRAGVAPGSIGVVVNRAARAEITPADVTRVFGVEPLGVLPLDRAVPRAQDHGKLLPARGRMARAFDRLATRVLEPG
ncbi:MAG: AAA family ATPase [Actinomycetota bacterium]